MEDGLIIEEVEFSEELYQKNLQENEFNEEYEAGDLDANN